MPESSRSIYKGRIINVNVEKIRQPDGRIYEIEIARHPGGSTVVAINSKDQICLIRQYRSTFEEWMWELPAGKIDPGDTPQSTAIKELEEEAGLIAKEWTSLGKILTCPGFSDETVYLYKATDLKKVNAQPEEGEYIETHWFSLPEAIDMINQNIIQDAKTVVGLVKMYSMQ